MILKQIELKNVKTHKRTIIPFKKGLNVFHGENGSGKSTVLEMIGFILFDYLERKKHDIYVREVHNDKPEFGTIRLTVIGANNEPYIIERNIGKPGIAVYNALSNKELKQISDTNQLKKWIRKQIAVSNNIELDKLFETSIGIPQGTFLAPFQRNPGDRKKYFDPILDLKIYEIMWSRLKQLSDKIYNSDLQDINLQISEIKGEIKDKSEIIEKRDNAVEKASSLTTNLKKSEKTYETLKKEYKQVTDLKSNLENAHQEAEKLTIKKDSEQKVVLDLDTQVKEAKDSKKICDTTHKNFNIYEELLDKQSHLQLNLNKFQKSQNELNDITNDYIRSKTQEEGVIKNKMEAEEAIKLVNKLKPKYDRTNVIEKLNIQNDKELTRITTIEDELEKKNVTLTGLGHEISKILKQLEILPEIEQKLEELNSLEEERDILRQTIAKNENKLTMLTQNQNDLKKGICPIFNQQCINLKEGSAKYSDLSTQIKEEDLTLTENKDQLDLVLKKLESKKKVVNKLEDLKGFEVKLEGLQKQETLLRENIVNDREKTKDKSTLSKIKESLAQEKSTLEPFIEEYLKYKSKSEEFSSIEDDLVRLKQEISKLEKEKEIKGKIVKNLEDIPNYLEKIQIRLDSLREDHKLYQTNRQQAEQLSKREGELKNTLTSLNQLASNLEKVEDLVKNLTTQFDEVKFNNLEGKIKQYEISIATLHSKISEKQERINELNENLKKIEQAEQKLVEHNANKDKLEVQMFFIGKMRVWLRMFAPKMRKALINQINVVASEIYRSLREEEDAVLTWQDDYDIHVSTSKSNKNFFRLSGGEKMSAALAVRLAILRVLTNANFAFFDEPTTNLDETTRRNLSKYIYNIKGFEQLFVISHDDSFKRHSEYVVKFTKDEDEITHVDYLTKKNEESP